MTGTFEADEGAEGLGETIAIGIVLGWIVGLCACVLIECDLAVLLLQDVVGALIERDVIGHGSYEDAFLEG